MQMQMQMQRMFMFSLTFADVELGVCRKELNSDIPPTHGYPQQVVNMILVILVTVMKKVELKRSLSPFIIMVMLLLLILLLMLMLKMLQLPHEEGPG